MTLISKRVEPVNNIGTRFHEQLLLAEDSRQRGAEIRLPQRFESGGESFSVPAISDEDVPQRLLANRSG